MAGETKATDSKWRPPGSFFHDDIMYSGMAFKKESLEACKSMSMRDGDVLIASYPKTGTTWTQEILYLIHNGADREEARSRQLGARVPCVEHTFPGRGANVDRLSAMEGQRLMFTHLRSKYFEQQIKLGQLKVILLMRDARDAMTSYYHFHGLSMKYTGSFNEFFEMAKTKELVYGDYYDWYADWASVKDLQNVLFLRYEDMKRDHFGCIKKIAEFVGKDLTDEQLEKIREATSFKTMQENPTTNQMNHAVFDRSKGQFMRKGQVGDWKNYFTDEQNLFMASKANEILKPVGMYFDE